MRRKNSDFPTLKDVALQSGVSVPTASRVLRGSPDVRVTPETKARILQAAKELNYRPNALARSLRTRTTNIIAFYIPSVANPVFPDIVQGAEQAAAEHGYTLFVKQLNKEAIKAKRYLRLLQERVIDGLVVAVAGAADSVVNDLMEINAPFILVNRKIQATDNHVTVDDEAGSEMAVDHLVELGHERIAFLSGPLKLDTASRRLRGYQKSLLKNGLACNNELVEESGWLNYNQGRQAVLRLLKRCEPTAIFASNLTLAVGALAGLREAGLEVPRDVSVICLHDAPLAAVVTPPLTVVKMPLLEMGYHSVRALIDVLHNRDPKVPMVLPPVGLVVRESTAKPR